MKGLRHNIIERVPRLSFPCASIKRDNDLFDRLIFLVNYGLNCKSSLQKGPTNRLSINPKQFPNVIWMTLCLLVVMNN